MDDVVCVECKSVGKPKRKKRGSGKLEFAGWMVFPLGLPYTFWRMLSRRPVCRYCGSTMILPANSISGIRLINIIKEKTLGESPVVTDQAVTLTPEPAPAAENKPKRHQDPDEW